MQELNNSLEAEVILYNSSFFLIWTQMSCKVELGLALNALLKLVQDNADDLSFKSWWSRSALSWGSFSMLIARLMVAKTHYRFWTPKNLPYERHTERRCCIKFLKYPFLESKAVQTISERIVIESKVDKSWSRSALVSFIPIRDPKKVCHI